MMLLQLVGHPDLLNGISKPSRLADRYCFRIELLLRTWLSIAVLTLGRWFSTWSHHNRLDHTWANDQQLVSRLSFLRMASYFTLQFLKWWKTGNDLLSEPWLGCQDWLLDVITNFTECCCRDGFMSSHFISHLSCLPVCVFLVLLLV